MIFGDSVKPLDITRYNRRYQATSFHDFFWQGNIIIWEVDLYITDKQTWQICQVDIIIRQEVAEIYHHTCQIFISTCQVFISTCQLSMSYLARFLFMAHFQKMYIILSFRKNKKQHVKHTSSSETHGWFRLLLMGFRRWTYIWIKKSCL